MMTKAGGIASASAMYRFPNVPTSVVTKPNELFRAFNNTASWNDFDLVSFDGVTTTVYVASDFGLLRYTVDFSLGDWVETRLGGPSDMIGVAVSNDKNTLYVTVANMTFSGVFAYEIATSSWTNDGRPILTPPAFKQFRGIAAAPIIPPSRSNSPTPSFTPSNSPTISVSRSLTASSTLTATKTASISSSPTASLSAGAQASATPSITASGSLTATPTSTMTGRGGRALPDNGVVVAIIGNGTAPIPNTRQDVLLPVTIRVFYPCGAGCASAAVEREIAVPSTAYGDAYGNRAATLDSGSVGMRTTFLTGRLVPSEDRSEITLGAFDAYAGYQFGLGKREPIAFSLRNTGYWWTHMPCLALRATASGLIDDPYYW